MLEPACTRYQVIVKEMELSQVYSMDIVHSTYVYCRSANNADGAAKTVEIIILYKYN